MATLRSLNVGRPKDVPWRGRTVHTGAWKHPVDGPLMVRRLNVDGDGQGDLQGHGGEQRAVLVYQTQSYAYWRKGLERDDLEFGQFGETSPSTGRRTTRCASATATPSAKPSSRSPSRA